MSTGLRFNVMHFMPYVHLPENHKDYKTTWVDFPNKFYDPVKGHELYQSYFEQLVLADRLGFDAIVLNEHHNTVYGMMATPNVVAAALIPQVQRARICVWGCRRTSCCQTDSRRNTPFWTSCRKAGWKLRFRWEREWNIGRTRSIPQRRGRSSENR